jgi:hypothetical protein
MSELFITLVVIPKSTYFLRYKATTINRYTRPFLVEDILKIVEEVRSKRVVYLTIDNASNIKLVV